MAKSAIKTKTSFKHRDESVLPTFLDHVHELQGRLFAILLAFLVVGGAAYPFFDKIVTLIVTPLGSSQQLVYLTPGGAFSFIIKVCLYVGVIGALPVIIYNLYRFLMPAVKKVHLRTVLAYTLASFVLAIAGVVFAYIVSLPAALHFLTNFELYHISPMLTIDSYFSFVMTYLLAGALLFQLPIVMLIINSATPLTPSKLMGAQKGIIVGSFIAAAIISPTPDALNQILLASPIIIMYQLGIVIVWLRNRSLRPKRQQHAILRRQDSIPDVASAQVTLLPQRTAEVTLGHTMRALDGFIVQQRYHSEPGRPRTSLIVPTRQVTGPPITPVAHRPRQTIDGFFAPARS